MNTPIEKKEELRFARDMNGNIIGIEVTKIITIEEAKKLYPTLSINLSDKRDTV